MIDLKKYENFCPDIYKIIKPVTDKIIKSNNFVEITKDILEKMSNEVYYAIEVDVNPNPMMRPNIVENSYASSMNRISSSSTIQYGSKFVEPKNPMTNNKPKNTMLKDMIKIIILDSISISSTEKENKNINLNKNDVIGQNQCSCCKEKYCNYNQKNIYPLYQLVPVMPMVEPLNYRNKPYPEDSNYN